MESLNDVTSYISFLSPEYLNGVGKLCAFVESDIEKVTSITVFYFHLICTHLIAHVQSTLLQPEIDEKKKKHEIPTGSRWASPIIINKHIESIM